MKLSPIVVPKTSAVLANELRKRILNGALQPGMSLPAERDLVTQTGLSRGSVREALRTLEAEHLVTTRPGRHGGSVARQPGDDLLAKYVGLFVQGRGIALVSLLPLWRLRTPLRESGLPCATRQLPTCASRGTSWSFRMPGRHQHR